jgi:hypothetical protein
MADRVIAKSNSNAQSINGDGNNAAGRDIINNYFPQQDLKMKALIEAYKQEQQTNPAFKEFVEELDVYLKPIKSETPNVIGLEKKLQNGHFDENIELAKTVKEMFYRKVEHYRFSKAAQNIFLYVMANVLSLFHTKIYQPICNDTPHDIIMSKIQDEIIDVLSQKLGENILEIYNDCILGMLYFLTGNCHIKWSKT